MNEVARDAALDWFVRRQDVGFSRRDEAAFQTWLQASPDHRAAYAGWVEDWRALDAIPPSALAALAPAPETQANANAAKAKATAAAAAVAATRRSHPLPIPTARRRFLGPAMAATGMVAVTGGAGLLAWRQWQATPLFSRRVETRRGQFADLPLPDGSRIELDTATRIEVTYYRHRREVRLLEGQAMFSVAADPARPFRVEVEPLRVTVVGTRFSMRHTPAMAGDDQARVAVEAGRVLVEARAIAAIGGDRDAVITSRLLGEGEQVSSVGDCSLTAVTAVADAGIAPWREFRVAFDNQRLDHALAELGRYREVALRVHDPAVAALPITGVFDPRDLATFRRVLPLSLPVRLRDAGAGLIDIVAAR